MMASTTSAKKTTKTRKPTAKERREAAEVDLAYLARTHRLANPRGRFDASGRWYPDQVAEGGQPDVRSPSVAWPYSYLVACRARKWCARLPAATRAADAKVARTAIAAGKLTRDERGRWTTAPEAKR